MTDLTQLSDRDLIILLHGKYDSFETRLTTLESRVDDLRMDAAGRGALSSVGWRLYGAMVATLAVGVGAVAAVMN